MKRVKIYALIAAAMLSLGSCTDTPINGGAGEGANTEAPFTRGELVVKFTPEVAEMIESTEGVTRSGATRSGNVNVDQVLDIIGSYRLERVFPVDAKNEERTRECGLHQWYIVGFDASQKEGDVARRLSALGEVQKVDLNRTVKRAYNAKAVPLSKEKMAALTAAQTRAVSQNDELLSAQWNLINRGDMFVKEGAVKLHRAATFRPPADLVV
jgi:hypothetical protein